MNDRTMAFLTGLAFLASWAMVSFFLAIGVGIALASEMDHEVSSGAASQAADNLVPILAGTIFVGGILLSFWEGPSSGKLESYQEASRRDAEFQRNLGDADWGVLALFQLFLFLPRTAIGAWKAAWRG